MNKTIFILLVFVYSFSAGQDSSGKLDSEFRNPPKDTRPWVFWYWVDENISKPGITKDLEAMARVGIGQALIGHISPGPVRGDARMLSKEWWDMVAFAVKEGQRLGVDIGFFNGPGWSQSGGPWISLDQSMRHVVSDEWRVRGPALLREKLHVPGPGFKQIALQAFPVDSRSAKSPGPSDMISFQARPETGNIYKLFDRDTATSYSFPAGSGSNEKITLDLEFKEPWTIQAIKFDYPPVSFYTQVDFQSAEPDGMYRSIRKFKIDRRNIQFQIGPKRFEPLWFAVPATRSRRFRFVFDQIRATDSLRFKEIELYTGTVVDQHIDKQLGKMASDPVPLWDAYLWPEQEEPGNGDLIKPESLLDLRSRVDAEGFLNWEIPPGDWVILHSGMAPTGAVNVPVPPEATGFECDKFSKEAIKTHFQAFAGQFLKTIPRAERTALKTIVIDSYEVGSQNWSNDFAALFAERFGYDPLPWLPVFAGRIVKSADLSNRFLWDVRRLGADLIAENYVGHLRKLSNRNGLDLWLENYGHWGFPAEFLQYGGRADMVSGEFWFENPYWDLGPIECRAASSAAHIYGKNRVFAEAFTAGFNFKQYPASMKSRGDRMFCEGINHFVLHLYIHQPWENRVPGVTAWFGMSFQRNNTWFEQSKAWVDYLRRCQYLLQQGDPVSDLCYFTGEDVPKMTGALNPALPSGYDYDFINAEVLERARARDGKIILPHGKEYRLLILPEQTTMRPAMLEKLEKLIADGAAVYGPPPSRSPSMAGYPGSDQEIMRLAMRIWGNKGTVTASGRSYGKGKLYRDQDLAGVLEDMSLPPDVLMADTGILWTHRSSMGLDIYFLSNLDDREKKSWISFRVKNRVPELWDPASGRISELSSYRMEGERTKVPVCLDPSGSVFIVFRKAGGEAAEPKARSTHAVKEIALDEPWQLHFPGGWDAPDSITVKDLTSWTDFSDMGIKYFSGTARYKNTFNIPVETLKENTRVILDLGEVRMMAEVTVNGRNLGVLWKKPYKTEITEAIRTGDNQVEIRITNTWWNRLVGDAKYPEGLPGSEVHAPRTFVTVKGWTGEEELMDSGLIGPVVVKIREE